MTLKKDLAIAVVLSFAASLLGLAYNVFSPSGIALVGQWERSEGVVTAREKDDVVQSGREINDPLQMKQLVDKGEALVVDVRSEDQYRQGHIPGARMLPIDRFDQIIGEFFEATPPEAPVIVYCSGRECHDSHRFADRLNEFGYTNVRVFAGGFADWQASGYPVETGGEVSNG